MFTAALYSSCGTFCMYYVSLSVVILKWLQIVSPPAKKKGVWNQRDRASKRQLDKGYRNKFIQHINNGNETLERREKRFFWPFDPPSFPVGATLYHESVDRNWRNLLRTRKCDIEWSIPYSRQGYGWWTAI